LSENRGEAAKRRVGLLGGTFDPPHVGHLIVADQVLDQLELDEVRLVVSNHPWQKTPLREVTTPERRLAMVEAAVDGLNGVTASAVELEIGGPSYSIATLEVLQRQEPDVEWLLIVGADAAAGLDTWHRADELRSGYRFVVVNRAGVVSGPPSGWNCLTVSIPSVDLSSSGIRAMVGAERSVRHLCSGKVIRLLNGWGLYRRNS